MPRGFVYRIIVQYGRGSSSNESPSRASDADIQKDVSMVKIKTGLTTMK